MDKFLKLPTTFSKPPLLYTFTPWRFKLNRRCRRSPCEQRFARIRRVLPKRSCRCLYYLAIAWSVLTFVVKRWIGDFLWKPGLGAANYHNCRPCTKRIKSLVVALKRGGFVLVRIRSWRLRACRRAPAKGVCGVQGGRDGHRIKVAVRMKPL